MNLRVQGHNQNRHPGESLLLDQRQSLRQQMRRQRRALTSQQQAQAAFRLCKHLQRHPHLRKAKHVAAYLPNDGELDPQPLIRWCWQQGKTVYLPVLHPLSHNRLWFVRYTPKSCLVANQYGIPEPKAPYRFLRAAQKLDAVLLPLVAFDPEGGRLGMGGGYYDRTFSFILRSGCTRPHLIGLAHELQKVDKLPVASWDVPLAGIATDRTLYQCR